MRRMLLAVALMSIAVLRPAMASGSIDVGTPLVSGQAVTFENQREVRQTELSPFQLQALFHWLERNRSGWQGAAADASPEPRQLQLTLTHSDGKITSISVFDRPDGSHYLRLVGPDRWAYKTFGGLLKSAAAARALSEKDLNMLQKLLRSQKALAPSW